MEIGPNPYILQFFSSSVLLPERLSFKYLRRLSYFKAFSFPGLFLQTSCHHVSSTLHRAVRSSAGGCSNGWTLGEHNVLSSKALEPKTQELPRSWEALSHPGVSDTAAAAHGKHKCSIFDRCTQKGMNHPLNQHIIRLKSLSHLKWAATIKQEV